MSVNAKMTAIADEIRELSGTSGAMGLDEMASRVGEANIEVNNQIDLIAKISSALEGKASGSGGSPNSDNIKTCTIVIDMTNVSLGNLYSVNYSSYYNGKLSIKGDFISEAITTIENVPVGTAIIFNIDNYIDFYSASPISRLSCESIMDLEHCNGILIGTNVADNIENGEVVTLEGFNIV